MRRVQTGDDARRCQMQMVRSRWPITSPRVVSINQWITDSITKLIRPVTSRNWPSETTMWLVVFQCPLIFHSLLHHLTPLLHSITHSHHALTHSCTRSLNPARTPSLTHSCCTCSLIRSLNRSCTRVAYRSRHGFASGEHHAYRGAPTEAAVHVATHSVWRAWVPWDSLVAPERALRR
jgi:hypothetical protein